MYFAEGLIKFKVSDIALSKSRKLVCLLRQRIIGYLQASAACHCEMNVLGSDRFLVFRKDSCLNRLLLDSLLNSTSSSVSQGVLGEALLRLPIYGLLRC